MEIGTAELPWPWVEVSGGGTIYVETLLTYILERAAEPPH